MMEKVEILTKLEEAIKTSNVGIELWFSVSEYNSNVVSRKMTFEKWFEQILNDSI